jgi:hypothetical protein
MTQRERRKLTAVDDPLEPQRVEPARAAPAGDAEPAADSAARARSARGEAEALFVRLPARESESLARAAFELRLHKKEIVAALIARHVDARTGPGLEGVRALVDDYRRALG